jgi:DNA-directed RNA polymerase specialized sigma54-like protein
MSSMLWMTTVICTPLWKKLAKLSDFSPVPDISEWRTALQRVQHLDVLGRNDFAGLQRLLHCTEHDVRLACSLIRSLDPKPGRWYDTSLPDYVIPDVIVRKKQSHWHVLPNRAAMPSARFNQTYVTLSQCSGQKVRTRPCPMSFKRRDGYCITLNSVTPLSNG